MVKGVNRKIIEINDTGSKYFERILLFVTPAASQVSTRKLEREAVNILGGISPDLPVKMGLRSRHKNKMVRRRVLAISVAAVVVTAALLLLNIL